MTQSYARIILHTTFSTKYRLPLIDPDIESRLHAILATELKRLGATVLRIGGVSDHVHIVHSLPRDRSLAELMQKTKASSSRWIKTMGKEYASFAWQDGYASFSADYRSIDGLLSYVANQHEHHGMAGKGMTYEQEYVKLLEAYGFKDYKTKYLFPVPPPSAVSEPFRGYGKLFPVSPRSPGGAPFLARGGGLTEGPPQPLVFDSTLANTQG